MENMNSELMLCEPASDESISPENSTTRQPVLPPLKEVLKDVFFDMPDMKGQTPAPEHRPFSSVALPTLPFPATLAYDDPRGSQASQRHDSSRDSIQLARQTLATQVAKRHLDVREQRRIINRIEETWRWTRKRQEYAVPDHMLEGLDKDLQNATSKVEALEGAMELDIVKWNLVPADDSEMRLKLVGYVRDMGIGYAALALMDMHAGGVWMA